LGSEDYSGVVRAIDRSGADGVLMLLIGEDAVHFNRAYAAHGLHQRALRLSTHMDENMLLATGAEATENLWAAAGYFETLATAESLEFNGRYAARFGTHAPVLSSLGESCYEGVRLLAALADRARALDVRGLIRAGRDVAYEGPRGAVSWTSPSTWPGRTPSPSTSSRNSSPAPFPRTADKLRTRPAEGAAEPEYPIEEIVSL